MNEYWMMTLRLLGSVASAPKNVVSVIWAFATGTMEVSNEFHVGIRK